MPSSAGELGALVVRSTRALTLQLGASTLQRNCSHTPVELDTLRVLLGLRLCSLQLGLAHVTHPRNSIMGAPICQYHL